MNKNIKTILNFWFKECKPLDWFKKDKDFDNEIKVRFLHLIKSALDNKFLDWESCQEGSLALIILLDQFTRNVFRGTKLSFAGDEQALVISLKSVERGYLKEFNSDWCHFTLIPMMHSEELNIQNQSLPLFQKYTNKKVYEFAIRHQQIISKFGRFPHRNSILGRKSTPEEIVFLKQPGSKF